MNLNLLRILSIVLIVITMSFGEVKSDEIRWLKLRTEIGLEEIINAVFVPGDTSILVTDANFKLLELEASTGIVKRIIPNIHGVIKFSDDKQFVYTYGWEKVKWPTGEVIGKYPVSGFANFIEDDAFGIIEKAGLIVGAAYQSDHNPLVWKKGIWVLNLNTFQLIDTVGFAKNYYYSVHMHGEGKYFITYSVFIPDWTHPEFSSIKSEVWDTKTLDTVPYDNPFRKISYQLGKIKTSPDGKWLCSVGGSLVTVFDNNTFEKKYEWRVAPDSSGSLSAIDISTDSRYLATAGSENRVSDLHIWDLTTGQLAYKYNNGKDGIGVPFLRYSYNGNYIVDYGAGGVCLFNNMLTSVPDNPDPSEPVLYPNPTTGEVILQSKFFKPGQLHIELFDLNGNLLKILYDGVYAQDDLRFDISFVSSGIYILKANQNNKVKTFKIIKEK